MNRDEGLPAAALLGLPVRLHDIQLARPIDVVLEADASRAIGLEVVCGDEAIRFLPLAAARIGADEIAVDSPLLLLDESDLAFYRRRGRTLRTLRGVAVEVGGRPLGVLDDLVLREDGTVSEVVVRDGERVRRVPLDASVGIAPPGSASAA